mmetsp:Transcript_10840/g.19809  ORF Transcript_10840/g.19809 Transcript_10840/m.19809 type:complete len:1095 (-) Transcript_10840:351-3635(-)
MKKFTMMSFCVLLLASFAGAHRRASSSFNTSGHEDAVDSALAKKFEWHSFLGLGGSISQALRGRGHDSDSESDNPIPDKAKEQEFERNALRDVNITQILSQYEKFHKENLGKKDTKYIIYSCDSGTPCGGMGDRMHGIATTLFSAILTKRVMLIRWTHPFEITEAFLPRQINWTTSGSECGSNHRTLDLMSFHKARVEMHHHISRESHILYNSKLFVEDKEKFDTLTALTDKCVALRVNVDLFNPIFVDLELNNGYSTRPERLSVAGYFESLLGSVFKFLFEPSPKLNSRVDDEQMYLNQKGAGSVAIHFRTGFAGSNVGIQDKFDLSDQPAHLDQFSKFRSCASNLRGIVPLTNITSDVYLATDSQLIRRKYCSESHTMCSDLAPTHIDIRHHDQNRVPSHGKKSSTPGWDGLIELMLLARSPCLVMSCSGMSLLAAHIGDAYANKCAYRGFDCQPFSNKISCTFDSSVSQRTWLDDEERTLLHLTAKRRRSEKNDIVLLFTNEGYTNFTYNAICHLQKAKVSNFMVISYDAEGCRALQALGLELKNGCIKMNSPQYGNFEKFNSANYKAMMAGRPVWIYEALLSGTNVLFMDSDIVTVQNPFPVLLDDQESDIQVQLDPMFGAKSPKHIPLNGGLFYVRSTKNSIKLLENIMQIIIKSPNLNDQDALNLVVQTQRDLKYRVLDTNLFPNGIHYFRRMHHSESGSGSGSASARSKDAPVMIHNNWVSGSSSKIERFSNAGLWIPSTSGQTCQADGHRHHHQEHREQNVVFLGAKREQGLPFIVNVLMKRTDTQLTIFRAPNGETFKNNSILVKTSSFNGSIASYLQECAQKDLNVLGAVHLGDSAMDEDISWYSKVPFVFRQYKREIPASLQNSTSVEFAPLGYTDLVNAIPPHERRWLLASERPNGLNFFKRGHVGNASESEESLLSILEEKPAFMDGMVSKIASIGSSKLSEAQEFAEYSRYRKALLASAFTLCPKEVNAESYCIYDAMEAGSIPIVLRDSNSKKSLSELEDEQSGVVWLRRWDELAHLISIMYATENGARIPSIKMDELQSKVISFWSKMKNEAGDKFWGMLYDELKQRELIDKNFENLP